MLLLLPVEVQTANGIFTYCVLCGCRIYTMCRTKLKISASKNVDAANEAGWTAPALWSYSRRCCRQCAEVEHSRAWYHRGRRSACKRQFWQMGPGTSECVLAWSELVWIKMLGYPQVHLQYGTSCLLWPEHVFLVVMTTAAGLTWLLRCLLCGRGRETYVFYFIWP